MSTTAQRTETAAAEAADPLAATPSKSSADYQGFIGLMSARQMQHMRLSTHQVKLDLLLHEAAESSRTEIAEADEMLKSLDVSIERMIGEHPEWMGDAKSLKTPFGVVKYTNGESLEPENEELTLLLIRRHLDEAQASVFIRTKEELNLEALERLDDATLKKVKVERKRNTYFKVEPAKVDMNKLMARKAVAK